MVAANCDLMAAMSAASGGPVTCVGVDTKVGVGEGEGAALGRPVTCGVKVKVREVRGAGWGGSW